MSNNIIEARLKTGAVVLRMDVWQLVVSALFVGGRMCISLEGLEIFCDGKKQEPPPDYES